MKLYFIALIPDEALRKEVHGLKQEIADKFGAMKALKLPAHITLDAPFKYDEKKELDIFQVLEKVTSQQKIFKVNLKDFGSFPPRTIFLKVENPESVVELFQLLQQELSQSKISNRKKEKSIHPHMTIAFRDLTPEIFRESWPEYEERKFDASFQAKSLFLLKHNGKTWDIYKEFLFQENN